MDKRLFTVVKKELKRIFTDRRLVFTTMILPALSIFVMYSLMGNMINTKVEDVEDNIGDVVVVGAPESFIKFKESSTFDEAFKVVYTTDYDTLQYESDMIDGELELLIIFDSAFDEEIQNLENPNLVRYYNNVEDYSREARWKIDSLLAAYEEYMLGVRIGSHDQVNVFDINRDIENDSLQDDQKATGKGLSNLFPMLIAIFLFSGAMSVGPDMIAGEKERGTMATLLVTPVKRETLAMGKVIALGIVAIVSSLSSFIGIIASMPSAGSIFADEGIDMSSLQFSAMEYGYLISIMIALVSVYVTVVCVISIISKSIKEANTYMAPIYMVVMISGFSTMFSEGSGEVWRLLIPVYGSVIALKNLFAFELTTKMVLYNCGTSLLLSAFLVYVIKMMFNSEKIMFNK